MATTMMIRGTTRTDRVMALAMVAGLALALIQYAQAMALPAHFV